MKTSIKLKTKKLNDKAVIPTRGSNYSAGYDLYACIDKALVIMPGETSVIGTGLALEIPKSMFGGIYARSGAATKKGLAPANKVGVIDSDYRGEIKVPLHNHTNKTQIVEPNERIAQIIIQPFISADFYETDELSETERDGNGFGSTGK